MKIILAYCSYGCPLAYGPAGEVAWGLPLGPPPIPHPCLALTLSGWTTSTARRYCLFTCPGVTKSAMPTGVQRLPSHRAVCSVDSRARMFLSLPSVQSRSCG